MSQNKKIIHKLYDSISHLKPANTESFFGFKLACSDDLFYKPQISLFIPYLGEVVQQQFIFAKGWQCFQTRFYHHISSDLKPTLRSNNRSDGKYILEAFLSTGKTSKNFYDEISRELELYKIREYLSTPEQTEDIYNLSSMLTVTMFEMSTFVPPKNFSFTHQEGNLFSGAAYQLNGFEEPNHLGSFYNMEESDLKTNIQSLFL